MNILFIQSDQHRYDCVGRSCDYPVHTPNIDRLAREGLWFNEAYTPIPLCCPARQALLSGRRSEVSGSLWNYDLSLPTGALEPGEYLWTRELKQAGYRTGFCGKWHVHPRFGPQEYGFEEIVNDEDYASYISRKYGTIPFHNGFFGEKSPLIAEDSPTHYMTEKALRMIRQFTAESKPWHIRLDFHEPHLPCRPSEPFASMYDPRQIPVWRSFNDDFAGKPYIQKQQLYNWKVENYTWEDWAPTVAMYYGAISQVDDAVGRVLYALDELGIADDTMVIYTSDHGDMCGGHRMMDKHCIMYDDVVKVPLAIRWPGKISPQKVCDHFVYNALDLPPTILEAAGFKAPAFFHGRSLMPLFEHREVSNWREDVVATYNGQQFGLYVQRMLRNKEWKYIWNLTDVDELYDLVQDPNELHNRIHDFSCQTLLAALRRQLHERLTEWGDPAVSNPWMRDQLLENRKL